MAHEQGSDSDDVYFTEVSKDHLNGIVTKFVHYLTTSRDLSAKIKHVRGKPAEMIFNFGTQSDKQIQPTNKILVRNVPEASDEDHIQMFFEYEKKQGGGPVKGVTLNRDKQIAIVEFERESAVDIVLRKKPIKMLGTQVEVEPYTAYLKDDELVGSLSVIGIPEAFSSNISSIQKDELLDASKELPTIWKPMKDNENLLLVTLETSDKEYKDVEKEFLYTLKRTPKIIKIERIQNQALYTQYIAKRKQMSQQNTRKDNERVLWHCAAADAVQSINAYGFNRSYCSKNDAATGNGVYFTVNTHDSDRDIFSPADASGHKRMYRCLVLTGDYCLGQAGMRVPPPKAGDQSHVLYDSVTNSVNSPMMFAIFNDCQAYPAHIITYT